MAEDFETLWGQARDVRDVFDRVFREVTGEDFNLEAAVRHYPVMALGIAAVIGGVIGWRAGRRSLRALPPPSAETPRRAFVNELGAILPRSVEHARQKLPEIAASEEARAAARKWFQSAIEPRLRRNIDNLSDRLDQRISDLLADDRGNPRHGQDFRLDDPES